MALVAHDLSCLSCAVSMIVLSLLLFGIENVFTTYTLVDMLCVVKGNR